MKETVLRRDELKDVILESGITTTFHSTQDLDFKSLMRIRVNNILLVSSRYDFYTLVDDGQLTEAITSEYLDLNLYYAPLITRVYSGEAALEALNTQTFDLVITMLRLGDMKLKFFSRTVKQRFPDMPLILLAYKSREFQMLYEQGALTTFDRIFIWSGDRKLFLAIIKLIEDLKNAPNDCLENNVRAIILIEDSPHFYSSYLPLIYTEIIQQAQILVEEGKNFSDKLLRQRARPKILHATNFEEAWRYFHRYRNVLLGVITDLTFQMNGVESEHAGTAFIQRVRQKNPDMPILVQSSQADELHAIEKLGVKFVNKYSRMLLQEVREFMKTDFGFGDFIFRMPDGEEIDRARNLRELQQKLREIPDDSLYFHARHDHFSNWLMARTRFQLAERFKMIKITEFASIEHLRQYILAQIEQLVISDQRGIIADFSREHDDTGTTFVRIGGGSLGGKARGLAFIDSIFKRYLDPSYFPNVKMGIPHTIVLCTDVFTEFMEHNELFPVVVENHPDEYILERFLDAELPEAVQEDLRKVLDRSEYPLAIRSSSLLEDTLYQPFAGIYSTLMLPNCHRNAEVRYHEMEQAIKFVYASTYFRGAKNYIEATGHRIEEERMAVIIQQMVGRRYDRYFYPHFSGVARSYNYYPFGSAKPTDGVAQVALGLGKTVVEGGVSLQFCPSYPNILPQFTRSADYFKNSQRKFYAVEINPENINIRPFEDENLVHLDIKAAEAHETLHFVASTYSSENDALYDGVYMKGPRVLTFAPVLNSEIIPLAKIAKVLLKLCETAMNCPVEIEFAGCLRESDRQPAEFQFLQVRPMVKEEGTVEIDFEHLNPADLLLRSENVLGNGDYKLQDVVFVKPEAFDVSKTREMASDIDAINRTLVAASRPYLLMGPGRWGSADPWLGIPVKFPDISGAVAIVENSLPNMLPDPSQGSHFFQNLTSFRIAYFTVRHYKEEQSIDWDWLNAQAVETETAYVKHVRVPGNIEILVDGQTSKGVVFKAERASEEARMIE
jgi:CheY-like chemotaxis protein